MAEYVPVTAERFAGKRWLRFNDYRFAQGQALVSLAGVEVVAAARAMPLAFVRQEGGAALMGVMSPKPDTNTFVGPQGQWLGVYVPALFRAHPFRLLKADGSDQWILCFDQDSGLISRSDKEGEPFYDESGAHSAATTAVINLLKQVEISRIAVGRSVDALEAAGLLCPWDLLFKGLDSEFKVQGLWRIDEQALNALDSENFLKLRRALPLAYAQLFAMGQVEVFAHIGRILANLSRAPQLDADQTFVLGSDGTLQFG